MKDKDNPYGSPEVEEFDPLIVEKHVPKAEVLLGANKGHLSIINHLRREGFSPEEAKRLSYPIFDEAKRKLMRSQIPLIIGSWILISVGILGPIALLLFGRGLIIISAAPGLGGVLLHSKIVRPSRLPGG